MKRRLSLALTAIAVVVLTVPVFAQRVDIQERAMHVAREVAKISMKPHFDWFYSGVIALDGGLRVYEATEDELFLKMVLLWGDEFVNGNRQIATGHVDKDMPGLVALKLYQYTGNQGYLDLANRNIVDLVFGATRVVNHSRFWADDLYMVCPMLALAGNILDRPEYFSLVVSQFEAYREALLKDNGLYQHTFSVPYAWGRANGWIAVALVECLKFIPEGFEGWGTLLKMYQEYMDTILRFQDEEGMWHQVLEYPESYQETSCTAMFVYSLAAGCINGWLPEQIREEAKEAAFRGFEALLQRLDPLYRLKDICVGTNAGDTLEYYFERPTRAGDWHGMAPLMWACVEIAELAALE